MSGKFMETKEKLKNVFKHFFFFKFGTLSLIDSNKMIVYLFLTNIHTIEMYYLTVFLINSSACNKSKLVINHTKAFFVDARGFQTSRLNYVCLLLYLVCLISKLCIKIVVLIF